METDNKPGITLSAEDFGTLCICALRYCMGRETYMPDLVRSIVRQHLTEMNGKDVLVMEGDCDVQERMELWGSDSIDKPGWLKWHEEISAELKRRDDERLGIIHEVKHATKHKGGK